MNRHIAVIAAPAAAFALVDGVDIMREADGWDPVEIGLDLAETLIFVVLIVAVAWAILRIVGMQDDHQAVRDHLARRTAQGEEWRTARAQEIAAMGDAITREFKRWGLSLAEIDVAGLLLKGASMKEIALARETSEATIRQQAQSIYRKSGLSGRVELSAYFLDSLLEHADESGTSQLSIVATD